jgi:L-lactate dehydrogenase complex protein LldE
MIKLHYAEALADDAQWLPRARALVAKTHELVSFLVNVRGVKHVEAQYAGRACYHDSCSSLREMRVRDEPRALLASIDGLSMSELKESEVCCGFGGLFSVKYPEISERMADEKIADAQSTDAQLMLGGDLGCLLHLKGRMQRKGVKMRVRHVAEVLAGQGNEPALGE